MTNLLAAAAIFTVTAYCPCKVCCGKANQPTASGRMPVQGVTVAGPRRTPFGTWVEIEGVGRRRVDDRLARRFSDGRFDVFFTNHAKAKQFGIRKLRVIQLHSKEKCK
jgi:3D (Asp-Asp-Asp) domain-containing protein